MDGFIFPGKNSICFVLLTVMLPRKCDVSLRIADDEFVNQNVLVFVPIW